jgi:hypothetical protein
MAPTAHVVDGTVRLRFEQLDEIAPFFAAAHSHGGFLLPLDATLKLYAAVPFELEVGDEQSSTAIGFSFEATVIQSFPAETGSRAAFQLGDWNQARQMELARKLGAAQAAVSAPAGDGDPPRPPGAAGNPDLPGFRIREMNVSERMRLATQAGRVERQVLLRDHSPQVLMGLLNNPRVEDQELVELVKSTHVNGAILKRIASNRRWAANLEIRTAIVRNPKTPTPLAVRLLEGLRTPDLGALAKGGAAREPLRRAALSLYLKRVQGR